MLTCRKNIACWGLALFLLTMTGCQSIESYYRGYRAETGSSAPLATVENQQGAWKTFDIDLRYRYDYAANLLNIFGTIDLGLYYEINTSRILFLDVYLFFLDDKARVMETAYLSRTLEFEAEETLHFTKSLRVPPGTGAIAFGYYGETWGDGDGERGLKGGSGGGWEDFYNLPKRGKCESFTLADWFSGCQD